MKNLAGVLGPDGPWEVQQVNAPKGVQFISNRIIGAGFHGNVKKGDVVGTDTGGCSQGASVTDEEIVLYSPISAPPGCHWMFA